VLKKTIITLSAIIFLMSHFSIPAEAGKGSQKSAKKQSTVQTAKQASTTVCPLGNTPGTGTRSGKSFGPGDGTGNGGDGPKDGTGYGAAQQGNGTGDAVCDSTGPKGRVNRNRP